MTSAARRSLAVLALAVATLAAACANLDDGTTPRCSDDELPNADKTITDKCFTERIAPSSAGGSDGGAGAAGESGSSGQAGSDAGAAGEESGAGGSE